MENMQVSNLNDVQQMYNETAENYAGMMDAEMQSPVYANMLGQLAVSLDNVEGPVIDTSCGSGHMLAMYQQQFDADRLLIGSDLSAEMVRISQQRLGDGATVKQADMCNLSFLDDNSVAGLISFFAIHHLDVDMVKQALVEWQRVLKPNGQLLLAAWEGEGAIDYGSFSDLVAMNYSAHDLQQWLIDAGYQVQSCEVVTVDDMGMDAVYISANIL